MKLKLNIGCGPHPLPGYQNIDLYHSAADVKAPADKLPYKDNSVIEILAEHLIEHLTFYEFNKAMAEWHRVLKSGGVLTLECPDLLGLCKQFVNGNEYQRYTTHNGQWPLIAHFYGHQRGGNAGEILGQVHKSGYTEEHLRFVLEGLGYTDIQFVPPHKATPGSPVLRVTCKKK